MYQDIPDGCSKHCVSRKQQAEDSVIATAGIMGLVTIIGIVPGLIIVGCAMGGLAGFFIAVGILAAIPALAWTLTYATTQDRHFH